MEKKRLFTIPNLLTMLRILIIPLFIWTYIVKRDTLMTALVLGVSGLTDILDGQIARRFNMVSDLGKLLDPIADKATQGAMLICLVTRFPVMWIPLGLLAVKEAFVGITSVLMIQETGKVEGAEYHGKVTTVLLYGMMLVHLLWGDIPSGLSIALIVITVLMMLISMVLYGLKNISKIKKAREARS